MNVRALVSVSALGIALLFTSACAESTPAQSPVDPVHDQSGEVFGTWGTPDNPGMPFLVFEDAGKLHGSDGCNTLNGSYTVTGTDITFGPIMSTRKYCEGIDDWLSRAATATLEDATLTFADSSGNVIGTLERTV